MLRAKKDLLDARAIAVQLRSEIGQNVLKLATTGATIQLIPLKMLLQMPVFLRTRRPWRLPLKCWKKRLVYRRKSIDSGWHNRS